LKHDNCDKKGAQLADTHAHLTSVDLAEKLGPVLARANEHGVGAIISVGTDGDDARSVQALADSNADVFAAYGIHPHEADTHDDPSCLRPFLTAENTVAIGETGLDYHYDFAKRANQRVLFSRHLELASELRLPVIVHCRDAFDDALAVIKAAPTDITGVFHCFTGNEDQARRVLDLGWMISFTGVLTFKKSEPLRRVAQCIPIDRMLIETDAPYLSPEPVRRRRPNEPANVRFIARQLAEITRSDYEKLLEQLWANTVELFGQTIEGDRK